MKKLLFYFSIFSFFVNSCTVNKIQFNTEKINSLQKERYKTIVNHQFIDINNLFISPEKIKSTTVNESKKIVQINFKKNLKLISGEKLLESLKVKYNFESVDLIIADGQIKKTFSKELIIDQNLTQSINILNKEKAQELFPHRVWNGALLVLSSKK